MNTLEMPTNHENIELKVAEMIENSKQEMSVANLKKIMNLIDLTTLSVTDNEANVSELCNKVERFPSVFPNIPNVAAVCVYPSLIQVVCSTIKNANIGFASVGGGFPASQTFMEIKIKEAQLAVERGATEIDIVLNVGNFLAGKYVEVQDEIAVLKKATGNAKLKVILETGALPGYGAVRKASFLAMDGGADFIKTSTGKIEPAATPEAFLVMVEAIHDFFNETGKAIGIKPAGGISTPEDALIYFTIVKNILGEHWLNNKLFRIGASRLSNNLLGKIQDLSGERQSFLPYF
ncbi:MAG: deoxyribose-phosphate aldolase [Bacteroidales bacterium]|nr:deoxyribose-phosphate aldolase [Bacteroidales bacterium]